MSFILDALKKSETERQRQTGPGFADVPFARPATRQPWWVFAFGALLIVNLLVLVYVLLRPEAPAPAATTSPAPAAVAEPTVPPATATPSPPARQTAAAPAPAPSPPRERVAAAVTPPAPRRPASASLAEEAGLAALGTEDEPTLEYPATDAAAAAVPQGPPIVQPLRSPAVRTEAVETLPTLDDLTLSGNVRLPEMHLDIHVFAPSPAERFVFINMRKYLEGQQLQEGPVVERITPDGVVLNQQGIRFVMPSQ